MRKGALVVATAIVLAGCSGDGGTGVGLTASALPDPAVTVTDAPDPATTSAPVDAGVYAIECDPADHARADAVTVLGPGEWRVGGWNHITGVGSFAGAALAPTDYAITAENYLEQPDCGGQRALETVLVKKTYDWDRQHANGIEATFRTAGLVFGDVQDIVLELRVDADRTAIPTAADLEEAYGALLAGDQLAALDTQEINLELTLFGDGTAAGAQTINAGAIVAVDPLEFTDGWVRVAVPREELTFYTETDYVRTNVDAGAHGGIVVEGLRINPETAEGATVRRLMIEAGG
ncbi:hypothetical protein, partial [uncultured Demequina sp.]|uniref:hypothetical protein n=1 Tax=uncultured Demequina sp. TaxID=693499 RepID=UPI0025F11B44